MKRDYTIRSIQRAAEVLRCFTVGRPKKTLTEIVEETNLHKSTVFRILETLEELNWVAIDNRTGYFRLGFDLFGLGSAAVKGLDIYEISHSSMEKLVKLTGQSTHLVIHDNGEALYLNKLEHSESLISQPSNIGMRQPLHCTAVGKIFLANMLEEDVREVIKNKELKKFTPKTITSEDKLFEELKKIKSNGYALDNEEIQIGLRCVASPIKDYSGKVVAAISASGLTSQFSNERLPFLVETVINASEDISSQLGHKARG